MGGAVALRAMPTRDDEAVMNGAPGAWWRWRSGLVGGGLFGVVDY